ncbi:hypothetical protein L7F22_003171 [Adiantum nelumboides]|nr:hypothetical protein [Adiantum nelumboides]
MTSKVTGGEAGPSRANAKDAIKQSNSNPPTPLQPSDTITPTNGIPDPSMAMAPYMNNNNASAFLQELGLGENGIGESVDNTQPGLWDFTGNGLGGDQSGLGFLNGGQFNPTAFDAGQNPIPSAPPSSMFTNSINQNQSVQQTPQGQINPQQSSPNPNQAAMLSTSRPTGSLIPTHVSKNNPFLNKLRSMVDDPKTDDLIRWSDDGETFLVPNNVRFGDEVLPRFFKHNRFSSFVRQLNMYGFHKVPHLQQGALKTDPGQDTELWEFRNDNFKRDRPELLLQMQRKKGVRIEDEGKEDSPTIGTAKGKENESGAPVALDAINGALTRAQRGEGESGLVQLASVWSAIAALQQSQQGINDNLRHLHSNNSDLWREAAEQRARSKKQEETINKMLRFLAGVFGAQDVNNIGQSNHRSDDSSASSSSATPRANVGMRSYDKNRRRLLIGDGTSQGGQIEELEVPSEDDNQVEELTPQARITEAKSGTNSPNTSSSPPSRFIHLPETPSSKKGGSNSDNRASLPFVSSETASTPGGGRRISQQAGAQLLNALASGEAQSWLANLFGQQQAGPNTQSNGTRNDNLNSAASGSGSFKLDAQTLAALQNIMNAGAQTGPGSVNEGSKQGGYFDNAQNGRSGTSQTTNPPNVPGWPSDSAALSPRSQSVSDQSQLSRMVPQQQQQLQNVTQDATAVQNALNALVEGLRIESQGNGQPNTTTANNNSVPSSVAGNVNVGGDGNGEVDMDSLLKEFFNENGAVGDNDASNDFIEGQTPAFAFSPGGAGNEESGETQSEKTSLTNSPTQKGTSTPVGTTTSRKRKPADDLEMLDDSQTNNRTHGGKTKSTRQQQSKN